jgi:nucleotide-binding universal stress UspA family protein
VVAAWLPVQPSMAGPVPAVVPPYVDDLAREKATAAAEAAREAAGRAGVGVSTVIVEDDATDAIAGAAREAGARLIVVGSHGWGAFTSMIMGSTTTRLLHDAMCPVVAVRAEPPPATGEHAVADEEAKS